MLALPLVKNLEFLVFHTILCYNSIFSRLMAQLVQVYFTSFKYFCPLGVYRFTDLQISTFTLRLEAHVLFHGSLVSRVDNPIQSIKFKADEIVGKYSKYWI